MRIALLADIHGNYEALEAVLDDLSKQSSVQQICVLGDLVFKGPNPGLCVEAVRGLEVPVIRGNIDEMVGEGRIQDGFAQNEAHAAALTAEMKWTRARLTSDQLDYLRHLPMMYEIDADSQTRLRCVHATPHSVLPAILPTAAESELDQMFSPSADGTVPQMVAYAHIHVPYVRFFNGRLIFNTGSVGLPFDGDSRASYALLTVAPDGNRSVELRRVRYDVERTVAAYADNEHPFASSVIQALRAGRKPL